MNTLSEYLKAHSIKQAEFAKKLNVKQATVSRWCNGLILPELETAILIDAITNGGVPANSWVRQPVKEAS